MLDPKALQQLVETQAKQDVAEQVRKVMTESWFKQVESDAIKFIQDRIVAKFANSEAMPELIDAVKTSVADLFQNGHIPGLAQYVDYDYIKQAVNDSTQLVIQAAINELSVDPVWLEKIEQLINQQTTQRVLASLSTVDIRPIIKSSVDKAIESTKAKFFQGIQNQAESVELTVMDKNVVVENTLTAKDISAVESLTVKNLVVNGTINTDSASWTELSDAIGQQTMNKITDAWRESLIQSVKQSITESGIDFDTVTVGGQRLVSGDTLSSAVTQSRLTSVGTLEKLIVGGNTKLNDTVTVNKKRVGINTEEPDMALSLWDEEVAVSVGKFKAQTAYIGTVRKQGISIGVNKTPAIEIDDDGLTSVKKIQVGLHKISHATEVPNYAGTRGDIVFNASPSLNDSVFAWQCLGGFKWKVIRAVQ
jgi:hypothetical protein